jgi:hypothetical protein
MQIEMLDKSIIKLSSKKADSINVPVDKELKQKFPGIPVCILNISIDSDSIR